MAPLAIEGPYRTVTIDVSRTVRYVRGLNDWPMNRFLLDAFGGYAWQVPLKRRVRR